MFLMTLTDLSVASVILPAIVGLLCFQRLTTSLKVIFLLAVFGCAVEYAIEYGVPSIDISGVSLFIYIIYTLVEFLLISLFYYLLAKESWFQKVIFWGGIAYICFFFGMLTSSSDIQSNFGYLAAVESVFLVLWVVLYFRQIILYQIDMNLKVSPTFWISTGFLLYFLGTFFLFAIFGLLVKNQELAAKVYEYIHSILHITLNLLICIGFYFSTRN
jgi:hypothetical protein